MNDLSSIGEVLPQTVRYVKNGKGGEWWASAKDLSQVHLGWPYISHNLLKDADFPAIEARVREQYGLRKGATKDYKMLYSLLDSPSQHLWMTFQDGCMWWCTVHDNIHINVDQAKGSGHFWLECNRPWSDKSLKGKHLAIADLPGPVTKTARFPATVCEPQEWSKILGVIKGEKHSDAGTAESARAAYQEAVKQLVGQLGPKDFELLIDLIFARSGWLRRGKLGGSEEGLDIEVENVATDEIAFVQVKSAAGQVALNKYVKLFSDRREHYQRMIFAVNNPSGTLNAPTGQPVQVWDGDKIANLVVRLGLGEWVAHRL